MEVVCAVAHNLPPSASDRFEVNPTEDNFPVAHDAISLDDIFSGGVPPVTYKLIVSVQSNTDVAYATPAGATADTDGIFTAKVEGDMLVISVAEAADEVVIPDVQYGDEAPAFVVEATDAQKGKALRKVIVAPNRAPRASATDVPNLRIGELAKSTKKDGEYLPALADVWAAAFDCTMFNLCTMKLADYFDDDGDGTLAFSARIKAESDRGHLGLTSAEGGILIEGKMTTAAGDPIRNDISATAADNDAVTVTVKATDALGSISRETSWWLSTRHRPERICLLH